MAMAAVVNIAILLMCLDLCYSTSLYPVDDLQFSRTGHVTPTSAKLLFRSQPTSFDLTYESSGGAHTIGVHVLDGHDRTAAVHLVDLSPSTAYNYSTTAGHQGTFTTRERDPERFSLISSSCQKPNWPYSPANHPLRIAGLEYLDKYLERTSLTPEMMLFLGDFICAFNTPS